MIQAILLIRRTLNKRINPKCIAIFFKTCILLRKRYESGQVNGPEPEIYS